MRLPHSVGEKATKKNPLEVVSIFGDGGTVLEEFGITESGNEIQCYVQVAPGDALTLGYDIPCTQGQIVDIFIDGVLREANVTTSRPLNIHRGKVAKVCACEIRPSGAKGKLEYCDMVVEDRKTTKDISPSVSGFNNLQPSAVGTIEVRILREIHLATKSHKDTKPEQATRGPTFEDNLRWWNVTKRVDPGTLPPTYQIGFINGRKTKGSSRKNINRSIEGYYLWASFKFLYRSASDIQATGFDAIDNPPNSSSTRKADQPTNLTGKMATSKSAAATPTDEKPFLSLKVLPEHATNQIDSDNTENASQVELIKNELQVGASVEGTQVFDSTTVAANEEEEGREIAGTQRSLHAYCETDHSDDETDTKQDWSNKDVVENANLKKAEPDRPIEQKKLSKRTPLPESRRAAIIIAEQAIAAYAEEATVTNARAENMIPVISRPKDFQDGAAIDKFLDSHGGSRDLCDSSFETHRQKLNSNLKQLAELLSVETNPKSLPELSNSSHINSGGDEEVALRRPELEDSPDVSSLPPPSSLSYMASTGATIQELGTDLEIEVAPVQRITNVQRAAPNSMMRAKAGHYMSRSPLVDPDPEDMERHARAMTNGKGDWRKRVTQMLQVLSTPPKNRALTEGSPSSIAPDAPTGQDLAAASLPKPTSETPNKRKFPEFNVDALHPTPGRPSSFSSQNGQGMSPKERRVEHARKKQAKQEAIEKAKAEAGALRRQVEESEVRAIAQEAAELEELDIVLENYQEETQALAARLRELREP